MIVQILSAALRAVLIASTLMLPVLICAPAHGDTVVLAGVFAGLAGLFIFAEYSAAAPSVLSFRFAAPFNRLRFLAILTVLGLLPLCARAIGHPTAVSEGVLTAGLVLGQLLDVPFSPVRLMLITLPSETALADVTLLKICLGIALSVGLLWVGAMAALVRFRNWPIRGGRFNVLMNLPLFDPTVSADVVERLQRSASFNLFLGFILPFVIPAVIQAAGLHGLLLGAEAPHSMIWVVAAWALVPSHLAVRGLALARIARLVDAARSRASAEARARSEDMQPA